MGFSIGGRTLPVAPSTTRLMYAADIKEIPIPTSKSYIISFGKKVDKLTISGTIVNTTKTASEADLLAYSAMVYTKVIIADTNSNIYDGTTWIMTSFSFTEKGGYNTSCPFKMELIRGSGQTVIS